MLFITVQIVYAAVGFATFSVLLFLRLSEQSGVLQEGGVFTFGAGGYGQLGHNSTNHEINPRKVFELMGNVVTQIACGR